MDKISEGLKNAALLGIGAAALVAEKASDAAEVLVKKGQETVNEGKALNDELKHKAEEKKKEEKEKPEKDYADFVAGLSEEELAKLKDEIAKAEADKKRMNLYFGKVFARCLPLFFSLLDILFNAGTMIREQSL